VFILSAAALAGSTLGCDGPVSPEGRRLLQAGHAAYLRGEDAAAEEATTRFLQLHPRLEESAEAYYIRGLARCREGRVQAGKEDLSAALRLGRRPDLLARAHLALGNLAYDAGRLDQAWTHYRAVLDNVAAGSAPADQAMFRLGSILQRQGRWDEADHYFYRVMHLFDGMELARRSAARVRARRWSVQVGAFATAGAAAELTKRLRAAGLPARTDLELRGGKLLRLVRVGAYPTHEQALGRLAEVRKSFPQAFLTPAR